MRSRGEDGSSTVTTLVVVAALSACAVGGLVAGAVLVASRQAAAAADLAALAGAESAQSVPDAVIADPCASARAVAEANAARLVGCVLAGDEVTVEVVVVLQPLRGLSVDVAGRARAGPVDPVSPWSVDGGVGAQPGVVG